MRQVPIGHCGLLDLESRRFSKIKYLTMDLPPIQGQLDQTEFFLYAAADAGYFDRFGLPLINSIKRNSTYGLHLHLYNPRPDQILLCQSSHHVSVTWENLYQHQFESTLDFWSQPNIPEPYYSRRNKMLGLKQFTDCANLESWIYKTYYACMRFVRMAELITQPRRFLEIDIDGLVRGMFDNRFKDDDQFDFYLYEKKKGGHLAGAILFTDKSKALDFIQDLAGEIKTEIRKDNIYWFLDQNCLDRCVPRYRRGLLPISYIDWHMQIDSAIWSAKGRRKELEIFQTELEKYR